VSTKPSRDGAGLHPGFLAPSFLTRMVRFVPILTMLAFTFMMVPDTGCGKGIFPEITPTITATTVPIITPTATASTPTSTASPLPPGKQFSARGTGIQATPAVGTCSGVGCGASSRHCECLNFTGTLTSSVLGNSTWTAGITVNQDDCTDTGTPGGFCCNGDGVLDITNGTGSSASILALAVTGPICVDPNSSTNPALFDSSLTANFEILTSGNTGKYVNTAGTGQINLVTNGTDAYLTTLGEINLGKP